MKMSHYKFLLHFNCKLDYNSIVHESLLFFFTTRFSLLSIVLGLSYEVNKVGNK